MALCGKLEVSSSTGSRYNVLEVGRGWILRGRRAPEVAEWEVGREVGRSGKSRTHRQVLVGQAGLLTTIVTITRYLTKTALEGMGC